MTALVPLLLACTGTAAVQRVEPTFLQVELVDTATGSEEDPLPFEPEAFTARVRVQALDVHGRPWAFDGDLSLDVRPGRLAQDDDRVQVVAGAWEGEVVIQDGFGPTRIWLSDTGDRDAASGRPASWATGVTDPIHFALPTVAEINRTDDPDTNQLAAEFAEVRVADRQVRVTAVGTNGFWVADLDDAPGGYSGLFVYTFSAPEPEVVPGVRLTLLAGNDQDYLGTTQLSFPFYEVDAADVAALPDPSTIDGGLCGDAAALEPWESLLVRLEDLVIPSDFVDGTPDWDDYLQYGQWPVQPVGVDGCRFYVDTSVVLPDFDPTAWAGAGLDFAQGMLTQVFDKWVLLARDAADLPSWVGGGRSAVATLRRPLPRPDPRISVN